MSAATSGPSPSSGASSTSGPAYTGATPDPAASSQLSAGGMTENVACALCYLLTALTGILFLVLEPYNRNKNVRFHAFQSIFFAIATVVAWIVVFTVSSILGHIPVLGWIIAILLTTGLGLGIFITWLMLMYKAYNNQRFSLPIIGPFAEKQA